MADLKAGTTVGGAMVWTQGNFPLFPSGNTLLYRDYTVYTTNDKPQAADNDFVSKSQGGTFEKTITMKGSISSSTMMQLQGTAVGTQYSLTDSSGALTGSNYQIYAQGDQFKFRGPNTVGSGLIDVLIWTNSTKRFDLSGNLYVSGSMYNLYDSTGGIFYSPKNKPTTTDIGLGNVTNDAQLKIASNLSDVANVDTARANISAAKSGVNSDITSLTALASSLRLGADGSNPQDATTLRQMQSAISAVSSSGGINGVMSTFVGDVSWWIGTASNIPTGYVLPVGQLSLRSDYPEVWALIDAGVLRTTTEDLWNESAASSRGMFTKGTVDSGSEANFRWPDLNGATDGAIGGLFLRGANAPSDAGGLGVIRRSAAPNITGSMTARRIYQDSDDVYSPVAVTDGYFAQVSRKATASNLGTYSAPNGSAKADIITLDASRNDAAYGRNGTTEVRPNSVSGYWIIRAKGTFSAQTDFGVFSSTPLTASATIYGGVIRSVHNYTGGTTEAFFRAKTLTDSSSAVSRRSLELGVTGGTGIVEITSDGTLSSPVRVTAPTIAVRSGEYEINFFNRANGSIQINKTSNVSLIDFGGLNVQNINQLFTTNNMFAKGGLSMYTATSSIIGQGAPVLASQIRDGGTSNGRVRANFDFWCRGGDGGERQGVIRVHGDDYSGEANWVYRGNGRITGSAGTIAIESSSDNQLKNIVDTTDDVIHRAAARVDELKIVDYMWNDHEFNIQRGISQNIKMTGVIAQQAESVDSRYVNVTKQLIGTADENKIVEIRNTNDHELLMDAMATIILMRREMKELKQEVEALRSNKY